MIDRRLGPRGFWGRGSSWLTTESRRPPDPVRQLTGAHDLCAEALRQRTVQGFLELLMPLISFTILVSI
jgi:hypothetical protein